MNDDAMFPFGSAILSCFEGSRDAAFTFRREDG